MINQQETNARLEASRGKNLLIVCCGVDLSKIAIYSTLKASLEVNVYCLEDGNNRLAKQLAREGAWEHIETDLFKTGDPASPEYVDKVLQVIREAERDYKMTFDGVLTIWDDAVGLAARVALAMGLPGNDPAAIDIAHDKYLSRQRLMEVGQNGPQTILVRERDVKDSSFIAKSVEHMDFPVIIKPGSGGSSIGVRKVQNREEVITEYFVCLKTLQTALKDGELMGINMGDHSATDIVIEEFLDGTEVDVDVILKDGEILYQQVMDDWPYRDPWFCELGCHFPTKVGPEKRNQFKEAAAAAIRAIGLTEGVHHMEFIDDLRRGPTLVEANPRMGGGPVHTFHLGAFGVDLIEEAAISALGLTHIPREGGYPEEGPEHALASCVTTVCHARRSGVIDCDVQKAMTFAKDDPDVALAAVMVENGDHVTGWDDGFPTSLARIDIVSRELTIDELLERSKILNSQFQDGITYK